MQKKIQKCIDKVFLRMYNLRNDNYLNQSTNERMQKNGNNRNEIARWKTRRMYTVGGTAGVKRLQPRQVGTVRRIRKGAWKGKVEGIKKNPTPDRAMGQQTHKEIVHDCNGFGKRNG